MTSQAHFGAALLDPQAAVPPGLTTWNGSDPGPRFAIYRNNVSVSLVNALADTFPVVQALVGEEFFRAMAMLFVRQGLPQSPVLADYGEGFADFIAQFEPAAALPYLADVARLEMARVRAYHAADAQRLTREDLALASAQLVDGLACRLDPHPSLQIVRSPFAVVSLWQAHQIDPVVLEGFDLLAPQDALVLRQDLDVVVVRIASASASWIQALTERMDLGSASELALAADPEFNLAQNLALLIEWQALTALG